MRSFITMDNQQQYTIEINEVCGQWDWSAYEYNPDHTTSLICRGVTTLFVDAMLIATKAVYEAYAFANS